MRIFPQFYVIVIVLQRLLVVVVTMCNIIIKIIGILVYLALFKLEWMLSDIFAGKSEYR